MGLLPCRRYSRTRTYFFPTDAGTRSCTADVEGCSAAELSRLLDEPVITSALSAHTLYGMDTRPVDGSVFRVIAKGGYFEIGTCSPDCRPAPVRQLQDLLEGIDTQQLAREPCKSTLTP
jgi:hypothetical protein